MASEDILPEGCENFTREDIVNVIGDVITDLHPDFSIDPVTIGDIVSIVVSRLDGRRLGQIKITETGVKYDPPALDTSNPRWHMLVSQINAHIMGAYRYRIQQSQTGKGREPTHKTRMRAAVFKELKDKHPEWSYATVAQKAIEQEPWLGDISGETVRNAYRAMGWEWERADRIR
jgi:hypothetical protein